MKGMHGLYEIKYEDEIINPSEENKEKWDAAEKWAKQRGIEFEVLTEKHIRTVRKENIWIRQFLKDFVKKILIFILT